MAGELDFEASVQLNESSLVKLEKSLQDAIARIEQHGSMLEQTFSKPLQDAQLTASQSAQDAIEKLNQSSKSANNVAEALEDASDGADDFKKNIKELKNQFSSLTNLAKKFGIGFGIKELITKTINVRSQFEKTEVAFKTMLGSEAEAQALMNDLVDTVKTTPLNLTDAAEGAKQLLAFGTASEDVKETMLSLGNVASGLSIPMNDLVYLYGTTITQGRMFTQDLRQMQARGIPIAEEIAKVMNVTKEEVPELVTAGAVTSDIFKKAFENMTSEGGKFYNLLQEQASGLAGKVSNIEDAIDSIFNTLGKGSDSVLSVSLDIILKLLEGIDYLAAHIMDLVAIYGVYKASVMLANIAAAKSIALDSMQAVGKLGLAVATTALEKAQKALNATMLNNPFVILATAIVGLIVLVKNLTEVEDGEAKGIQKAKDEHEKYQEQLRKEQEDAKGYISIMRDKNKTINEQASAYRNLQKTYKEFSNISFEEMQMLTDAEINELIQQGNINKLDQNIKDYEAKLKEIENKIESQKKSIKSRYDDANWAGDIANAIEDLGSGETEAREYLRQLQAEQESYKKYLEEIKTKRDSYNVDDSIKIIKNKEYWEKVISDAEEAMQKMSSDNIDYAKWDELIAKIKEAQKELKKYKYEIDEDEEIVSPEEGTKAYYEDMVKSISDIENFHEDNIEQYIDSISDIYQESKNALEKWDFDGYIERGKKLSESLNSIRKEISQIRYDAQIKAFEKELELTTDINTKLRLRQEMYTKMEEQLKNQHNVEVKQQLQSMLTASDYQLYEKGQLSSMTEQGRKIVSKVTKEMESKFDAEMIRFQQDMTFDFLSKKTDYYKEYASTILQIEQELADKIKEINEDEALSQEQKDTRIAEAEKKAANRKILAESASGVSADVIAEVQKMVSDILALSEDQALEKLKIVIQGLDAKIKEYTEKSQDENLTQEQRTVYENAVIKMIAEKNLLIEHTNKLLDEEADNTEAIGYAGTKAQQSWIKFGKLTSGIAKGFSSISSTANDILSTVGGALDETTKEALKALSEISNFAEGVFSLIEETSNFTKKMVEEGADLAQQTSNAAQATAEATAETTNAMMASNIIGWVMLALQMLIKLGTYLAQFSTEGRLKKELESTRNEVEMQEKAYANLEKKVKLEGNVGTKALKDKTKLANELNKNLETQRQELDLLYQLEQEQIKKYGENSDKVAETREEILDAEGAIMDTEQEQLDHYKELFNELATTDVESFAESMASAMVEGFSGGLDGMSKAFDDTVDDLVRSMFEKQLALRLTDTLKPAFDLLEEYTKDGDLTNYEIERFTKELEKGKEDAMAQAEQWRNAYSKAGLLDEGVDMESESKGFETMSQDTSDELNARFTALQMIGADMQQTNRNIDMNTIVLTQQNAQMVEYSRGIADQMSMATQIAQNSLYELRKITDNTSVIRSLDDRLRNIEAYTSKL